MGYDLFEVKDEKVTLQADKEAIHKLWENYYVPYVKGYFVSYGKFGSDDVKTGDTLAYTGSTASSMYFPDKKSMASGMNEHLSKPLNIGKLQRVLMKYLKI